MWRIEEGNHRTVNYHYSVRHSAETMGCECSAEDKPNRSCALSSAMDHTEDLKMVIMVHRHGARHPTKQLGGDLCWPANKQFWESYKAQLTPTGAQPAENPFRFKPP